VNNLNSKLKINIIEVPQGSTLDHYYLGSLFYFNYINDLPKGVDYMPKLNADDTCLVVTAPPIEKLKSRLNSEMSKPVIGWHGC